MRAAGGSRGRGGRDIRCGGDGGVVLKAGKGNKDSSGFMSMRKKGKARPKLGGEEFTISGPSQFRKEEAVEQPTAVAGMAKAGMGMGNMEAVEVLRGGREREREGASM